jgi:hypothetical protein
MFFEKKKNGIYVQNKFAEILKIITRIYDINQLIINNVGKRMPIL